MTDIMRINLIVLIVLFLSACNSQQTVGYDIQPAKKQKPVTRSLDDVRNQIETEGDMKLPKYFEVLRDKNYKGERDAPSGLWEWVLFSKEPFVIHENSQKEIYGKYSQTMDKGRLDLFRKVLVQKTGRQEISSILSSHRSDWDVGKFNFRGTVAHCDKGYYMVLKRSEVAKRQWDTK